MHKTIKYQKLSKMMPRDGVGYATTYVKQTAAQRQELCDHINSVLGEIKTAFEQSPREVDTWLTSRLKGFKTTTGPNRTPEVVLNDMIVEATGKKKNGELKDFALAPIERWSKLFHGTRHEIILVEEHAAKQDNYNKLFQYDV